MKSRRALITGISGFAGKHLASELRNQGTDVFGYTLNPDPASDFADNTDVGDIVDAKRLTATIVRREPDVIYHLAGRAAVGAAWDQQEEVFIANTLGAAVCVEAAATVPNCRVVLASSGLVYGQVDADALPVSEEHARSPRGPYAASKACAEVAATATAMATNVDLVIVRPFNFVGPGQGLGFVTSDFAHQIAAIERGDQQPVMRVGNLEAERDFTDVRDFVRGVAAAGQQGLEGRIYNLCSGQAVAISAILEMLLQDSRVPIEVESDPERMRPSDVARFVGDNTLAREELSWEPRIEIAQTLSETLDWWRQEA